MTGYLQNIEEITLKNEYFRQVLFTGEFTQLVVMSLAPAEAIGVEVHKNVDQFFRIEAGAGTVVMNGQEQQFKAGDAFIVPSGTEHNVINSSTDAPLKLYTLYSPPHHKDGTIHKTKAEALTDHEDHV